MHENSQQFVNMSQLVKIAKIQNNYSYAPLGGAIAEKPAFGPITPKPYIAHSKNIYLRIPWIQLNLLI